MKDQFGHPVDLLQDAVDDRLDAAGRSALDAHLAGCEACRRELSALRWTRTQMPTGDADEALPPDLTRRITAALDDMDAADAHVAAGVTATDTTSGRWWWAGLAAAAAIVVAVWMRPQTPPPPVPTLVAADLQAFADGALMPEMVTSIPADLDATFRARSLGYPVRVFDFSMMKIALAGGGRHQVGDAPSALMAYRGADGSAVLCQMYVGTTTDLPDTPDRRRHNDIDFFVYREGGTTVVFWQEGNLVCVLAATADTETTVQLAFDKAVKV